MLLDSHLVEALPFVLSRGDDFLNLVFRAESFLQPDLFNASLPLFRAFLLEYVRTLYGYKMRLPH